MEEKCLVVTRHELISKQLEDIKKVCKSADTVPVLPTEYEKLKEQLNGYTAVIANLPIPIILTILQLKKSVYTFKIENLETVKYESDYEAEKQKVLEKYKDIKDLLIVQDPDLKTRTFRVSKYVGLQKIIKIDIVTEDVTKW